MLREGIAGHCLQHCVFVNEQPSSGTGNQFPVGLNSQGRWEPLYSSGMSVFSETQSAQRRSAPLVSTEPERLFLFCLTLSKKREVFPESRIIYSRDQKASHPENFFSDAALQMPQHRHEQRKGTWQNNMDELDNPA